MFAYCSNNPVAYMDHTGMVIETVFDAASFVVSLVDVINDPKDPWNWVFLVGDLIDFIPFLTGVGESLKLIKVSTKVDNLIDGFSGLSKAQEYGTAAYKTLRKKIKGLGLEAHHIIEQRFLKSLGKSANDALSVVLTPQEHQRFTNLWRQLVPYGTDYSQFSLDDIWGFAQQVYKNYPELLQASWDTLFG